MRPILSILAVLILSTVARGQLTVPDVVAPYQPIIVGCNCIIPANGQATFSWQTDDAAKSVMSDDTYKLYVWAPPGPHMVRVLVVVKVFADVQVLVVDPNDPQDKDKWRVETIKVIRSIDFQNYEKRFTVGTKPVPPPGPDPEPDPDPTPGPVPTEPFAKEAYAWMKAIPPANYSKEKAIKIAENYKSIGAAMAATNDYPNLKAAMDAVKIKNREALAVEDIQAWGDKFFNPLSVYQAKLFNERNLSTTDKNGIAKIFNETGTAIKVASDAINPPGFSSPLRAEAPIPGTEPL